MDKKQNPKAQIFELRRYCKARGIPVAHEIVDHGFTGTTGDRPGLKKLQELARRREIDAVIVYKLDRLFRSLKHLVTTLDEFQELGVIFISVSEGFDYSLASGKLLAQIIGSLNQFEVDLIRERTRMGMAYAREQGKQIGRPFKHDANRIRELRGMGYSYRAIKKELGVSMGVVSHALKGFSKPASSK